MRPTVALSTPAPRNLPKRFPTTRFTTSTLAPQVGKGRVVKITGIQNKGRTATVLLRGSNKMVLEVGRRAVIYAGLRPASALSHKLQPDSTVVCWMSDAGARLVAAHTYWKARFPCTQQTLVVRIPYPLTRAVRRTMPYPICRTPYAGG